MSDESPVYTNLFEGIFKPGVTSIVTTSFKQQSRSFQLVDDVPLEQ